MTNLKTLIYNISSGILSKGILFLMSLLIIPFYIKYLGVESYGLVGIYTSIVSALYLFDFGCSTIVSKEMSQRKSIDQKNRLDFFSTLEIFYLVIGLLIGIFLFIFSSLLAKYWITSATFSIEYMSHVLRLFSIAVVAQWPHSLYSNALFGLDRQTTANYIVVISTILKMGLSILVLHFFSKDIYNFIYVQIACSFLLTLILRFIVWKTINPTQSKAHLSLLEMRYIRKFVLEFAVLGMVLFIVADFDKLLLIKMLRVKEFGYYSIAMVIPAGIMTFGTSIKNALFPSISSDLIVINPEVHLSRYIFYNQLVSITILPIAILFLFNSEQLLFSWTRDSFLSKNIYFLASLLTIGCMLNVLTTISHSFIIIRMNANIISFQTLLSAFISLPILIFLIPKIGVMAGGVYWILLNLLQLIFQSTYLFKNHFKTIHWHDFLLMYYYPMVVSAIISLSIDIFCKKYNLDNPWILGIYFIGIVLIYIGLFLIHKLLNTSIYSDIKNLNISK